MALRLPNLPDPRVQEGDGSAANVVLRQWGEPPELDFAPRAHDELAAALGILDLPRATKLAGTRFPLLLGMGARLARALAALMLELHAAHGYVEIAPPHLLRRATLEGWAPAAIRLTAPVFSRDDCQPGGAQLVALHRRDAGGAQLPLAYPAATWPSTRSRLGGKQPAVSSPSVKQGGAGAHRYTKRGRGQRDAAGDAEAVAHPAPAASCGVLCAGKLPFSASAGVLASRGCGPGPRSARWRRRPSRRPPGAALSPRQQVCAPPPHPGSSGWPSPAPNNAVVGNARAGSGLPPRWRLIGAASQRQRNDGAASPPLACVSRQREAPAFGRAPPPGQRVRWWRGAAPGVRP